METSDELDTLMEKSNKRTKNLAIGNIRPTYSRLLVISVSPGDPAGSVGLMNCVFTAQRMVK